MAVLESQCENDYWISTNIFLISTRDLSIIQTINVYNQSFCSGLVSRNIEMETMTSQMIFEDNAFLHHASDNSFLLQSNVFKTCGCICIRHASERALC